MIAPTPAHAFGIHSAGHRRAASTVGWAALCLFVSTVSLIGASLAPWPESRLLAYGPVLFGGAPPVLPNCHCRARAS